MARQQVLARLGPILRCKTTLLRLLTSSPEEVDTSTHVAMLFTEVRAIHDEEMDRAGRDGSKAAKALAGVTLTLGDINATDVSHAHRSPAYLVSVINHLMMLLNVRDKERAVEAGLTRDAVKLVNDMRKLKGAAPSTAAGGGGMSTPQRALTHSAASRSASRGGGGRSVETRTCRRCDTRGHLEVDCPELASAPRVVGTPARR